jgi:putative ABC transport system permease protein
MLQDYKLGVRALLKFPGLTIAGGLALAIAIGVGAGWYDIWGKILSPTIPLPEGDRLVLIETQNTLTNRPELRIARDFLEWRRELKTIEALGAYRTVARTLATSEAAPEPIQIAELTAAAFRTARVPPLLGRGLLASDETPGAPGVIVLGYNVWQRSFGGRQDVVGLVVNIGNTPAMVVGVMPDGFAYPVNHDAWFPLQLRGSYGPLEAGAISVIGRLAAGVTRAQADAELRVLAERAAAAFPATHEHLQSRVAAPGEVRDVTGVAQLALTNLPALLVLLIACMSVGTLVYARTATREGEIALRSALGASRGRIIGQLFVETLVLTSVAAACGLIAADSTIRWGMEALFDGRGGAPFWIAPGLKFTTILYAGGLAVVSAGMLSLLPALKATRARVQPHLANLGSSGATLRFGRVWTGAMITQVALTAIAIPAAMETASETIRNGRIRASFPSGEFLAARIELDRAVDEDASAFEARRARAYADLERRIAEEPGVIAVTFADRAPGTTPRGQSADVATSPGSAMELGDSPQTWSVGAGFFEAFDRPIVLGRAFQEGDRSAIARTVIVNEAFARRLASLTTASPIGSRLRYRPSAGLEPDDPGYAERVARSAEWFDIVGIVRDLGLDPDDRGRERPAVFHAASAGTLSSLVMSVRVRGNPATYVARLPIIAADVDASLSVQEARTLEDWISRRDMNMLVNSGALVGTTSLVLFLSALGIYSLMSVTVSRRTREIGLRAALGARPRDVLAGTLSRAAVLIGSGVLAGGFLLLLFVAASGDDVALYAGFLAATTGVMLVAALLASIVPARRALRISPTDALREA